MPSDTLVRPSAAVKIDGTALTSQVLDRVVRLRAELSFGQASRLQMTVVLYDGWESVFKIGATYEIGLDPGTGTPQPVLKGEITALAVEADKSEKSLIITGHDKSHRLGNNVKVVTHVEKSYGDIIGQIASAAGLTPKVHAALSTPRFPHIVQAASDLAFVADIARRTGMEFGVEGNELRVHPRTAGATVTLEMGEVLRSFEARYTTSERPTGVQVTGWDAASKQTIVATDEGELRTSMGSVPVVPANPQPRFGARQVNTWQGALTSIEEAKSVAKGIARRMTSHELSGEGETIGLPTIVPGCMVGITGIDAQWNGSYYVTSVEHLYAREAYVTRFTVGGLNDDGLVDLVAGPASHSVLSALPAGVTIGIVTNTKDTNNQHKSGHVKVKFPYLNDSESWWARVATIGAGANRGVMFMPEINDEVLVAFEHGDIRRPYVIGSLWNGRDQPPLDVAEADTKDKRIIVSRTGHKLTFFDGTADNKSNVTIVLADGTTKLHLGKDKIELISNNKSIELKHSQGSILLKDNGDIELSGMNIKIKAKQNLELEGVNVKVKANASAELAGNASLALKGGASAKLEASGVTEVKGSLLKLN